MIYSLEGKVLLKEENFLVLQTGGVGFKVFISKKELFKIKPGDKIFVYTFFNPETFELYGFLNKDELNMFSLLNTVSGIGPKMALKIMNGLDCKSLSAAIFSGKSDILSKKGGISSKTALKIILELKEKVEKGSAQMDFADILDLEDVLKELGYAKKDIDYAVSSLTKKELKLEEKVKEALKILAVKRR